ncbi:hypothetical protein L6R52_26440 [Myxococcota bacterium]|nr:hypothetical protein [Myxococcota bacterium]
MKNRRSPRPPRLLGPLAMLVASAWIAPVAHASPEDPKPAQGEAKPADPSPATTPDVPKEAPAETQADPKADAKPSDGGEPAKAAPAGAEEPALDEGPLRGISWDLVAGGIPPTGALVEGQLGFSGLPRLAYHHSVAPDFSLGASVAFDFAYWAPERAFKSSLLVQAPMRLALHATPSMNVGLKLEPGIGFFFGRPFTLGILANAGAVVGFRIEERMILGAGIDVPLMLWIPTEADVDPFLTLPILLGPVFELHVTPPLALTLDFKMGPHLNTTGGTTLGLKLMAGVAFRL